MLVSGLLTLRADHSIGGIVEQRKSQFNERLGDGRSKRLSRADRREGEVRLAMQLRSVGGRSARSAKCGRIATRGSSSHGCGASPDPKDSPQEGGGGFPEWKPFQGCASERLAPTSPA